MNKQDIKVIFLKVRLQLILLSVVLIFFTLSKLNLVPSSDELFSVLKNAFEKYGIWIILITSFLENLFGVNTYVPGAVVILTGMSLTHGNIPKALVTFLSIYLPVVLANIINFAIGKRVNIKSAPSNTNKKIRTLFLTLWHPYLASITSFQLGTQKISYWFFIKLFVPISLIWNIIWGVIAYNSGAIFDENSQYFILLFILYLLGWIIIDIIKILKTKNKN